MELSLRYEILRVLINLDDSHPTQSIHPFCSTATWNPCFFSTSKHVQALGHWSFNRENGSIPLCKDQLLPTWHHQKLHPKTLTVTVEPPRALRLGDCGYQQKWSWIQSLCHIKNKHFPMSMGPFFLGGGEVLQFGRHDLCLGTGVT